jgi:DNA-binding transcriptional LysR family regulator
MQIVHITFRQLQVYEAVSRLGSVTRAARELHLSQPAVSMQVKQLEHAVGLPLLEQAGRRLHRTDAGELMAHHARAISEQRRETEDAIEDLKGGDTGRLRISVATTVNVFAARLLADYCRSYPRVDVSLDVTNRETVIRRLAENTTDIVLMGQPPAGLDVVAEPFMENPLVVIAEPEHPLASRRRIPLSALEREPFLIREPGSGTRLAMERFYAEQGVQLTRSIEMSSNEAIKQSVEAGLGLGVVSRHTIGLELEAGRLAVLPVARFPIRRTWYVTHRAGKRLSGPVRRFREFVLAHARAPVVLATQTGGSR